MNLSRNVEIVGADIAAPAQPKPTAAQTAATIIDSIGGAVGTVIGQSKYGKQEVIYQESATPAWLLPVGLGVAALVLIAVLKK